MMFLSRTTTDACFDTIKKLSEIEWLEPIFDETLSSWLYRLNVSLEMPVIFYPECRISHSWLAPGQTHITERFLDPDLVSENLILNIYKEELGIPHSWIDQVFHILARARVPAQFRNSFCIRCYADSIKWVGLPACKTSWIQLTRPQCEIHCIPLIESPFAVSRVADFPAQTLLWYCGSHNVMKENEIINNSSKLRYALSLRVQQRVDRILKGSEHSQHSSSVEAFVITLMRAVMMPILHHAYPKIAFRQWGYRKRYQVNNLYLNFFQEIYCSSSLMRTHALYLCGIVLGWVSESEALSTSEEALYSPCQAGTIWDRINSYPGLMGLMASELKKHECPLLKIQDLRESHLVLRSERNE